MLSAVQCESHTHTHSLPPPVTLSQSQYWDEPVIPLVSVMTMISDTLVELSFFKNEYININRFDLAEITSCKNSKNLAELSISNA